VHAAHAQGIVHRDLKPENVMYDPATRQVKLLDFGIAADTGAAPDERLTRAGFFVGTLLYVAPEALSGELVTPAADQYSLATIAYLSSAAACPTAARAPASSSRSSSRSRRPRSPRAAPASRSRRASSR
jgi:serine/threonine-protein kinase